MRNKIVWKFLFAYIPLILFAVIVLNFFLSISLRNHFEQKITDKLYSNSLLVGNILRRPLIVNDRNEIQREVSDLGEQLGLRITLIDKKGVVLGDSDEDPQSMENHGNRPEIIEAIGNGIGESTRFSDTLNFNMKYVATPVLDNNDVKGIIRLSMPLKEVDAQIRVIYQAVLIGGIIAAFLSIFIGYYISKSITNPISEMKDIAKRISTGDFSKKVKVRSKDELGSLAQSLNTMADELQDKIDSLKRMDKMRTDFVANVSHELKTPLTSIKGYVETLEDGALEDKENAHKFLSIIKRHADSLGNIVNDLLILAEIESNKQKVEKNQFDLKELLDEVILGFRYALSTKKLKMEFSAEGNNFEIQADRGKIEQVFVNLIDNAVKYTNEEGAIKVSIDNESSNYLVTVADNGIGIPRSDINRVFERFYRVDKARSRELGGTGLGLAIAKHIVALHRGKINLISDSGKGTTITITLPKA